VEVLSDTTAEKDQGHKLAEYRALPSVQGYLLVNDTARLVEHYHQAGGPVDLWGLRPHRDDHVGRSGRAPLGR